MDGLSTTRASSTSWKSTSAVSEQPMSPKSRPGGLDLYGKRRQLVKVQILEREIGLLQEELKSIEGLQPASRCCKELEDFIGAKPDPLVEIIKGTKKSHPWWKRLWWNFVPGSHGFAVLVALSLVYIIVLAAVVHCCVTATCLYAAAAQKKKLAKAASNAEVFQLSSPHLGCCCCCCCCSNIFSCAKANFGCNCSKTCCNSCYL